MRWSWCIAGWVILAAGCVPELPERVRDYNDDGVFLYQHGDFGAARESFQAALALQPADVALQYNVGQCYAQQGDLARAEQCYRQCLQRAADNADYRHALVAVLVRQGRSAEARQLVDDWLAREPARAAAYAEDGWLFHQAGDLPRAQARLQQALELDPHEPRALIELALVYEALQRPNRAADLYRQVLERDPHNAEVSGRVNALVRQGIGPPRPD